MQPLLHLKSQTSCFCRPMLLCQNKKAGLNVDCYSNLANAEICNRNSRDLGMTIMLRA